MGGGGGLKDQGEPRGQVAVWGTLGDTGWHWGGGSSVPAPSCLQVALEFEEHLNVAFSVVSASCQAVHEYLGGYVCMGGRAPGRPLDMELFYKLTGGHEEP